MPGDRPQLPLVSVGVPVFNEEASLPAALDSILAQEYVHLEVIVCDNALTDGTVEIARDYAARDTRVTVHESGVNRAQPVNFNRCISLASGRYFTLASGHDTRLPQAIGNCVAALESDPGLVLCYPRAVQRGWDGRDEPVLQGTAETRGLPPALRLQATVLQLMTCEIVYGVIRSSALTRTRLFRPCFGTDHVLLAELSLLGDFHELDEVLFVRVENRPQQEQDQMSRKLEMGGVRTRTGRARPFSVMLVEHAKGAWHVSMGKARVANAWRAASLCLQRWDVQIGAEWPLLSRLYILTVARLRGVASRRMRAA